MFRYLLNFYYIIKRLVIYRNRWVYDSVGRCPTCGLLTVFAYSKDTAEGLGGVITKWDYCDEYKRVLLSRENFFCLNCLSNLRLRALSSMITELLGLDDAYGLGAKLSGAADFRFYETAAYNVFRYGSVKKMNNYVVSEYFENEVFGKYIHGVRNENLESLTFDDEIFDVLVTSDVLEHVVDLNKVLGEIYRVLKPGGMHVFSIPVNYCLDDTQERAKLSNGSLVNILLPVVHGDSIRDNGILAFRDFGKDVTCVLGRKNFLCEERKIFKEGNYVTSVFYAIKSADTR